MGFFDNFSLWGGGGTGWLLPFLFVLTIVVFFHELGHFLVARLCGVRVLVFSVGFGPELLGFNDRHGTRWKISAIPLGGYVKFFGDEDAASTPDLAGASTMTAAERRESFHHQSVGKRAAIVAAGPIANFILAILIFAAIFVFYGKPSNSARVDGVSRTALQRLPVSRRAMLSLRSTAARSRHSSEMQRVVSTNAGQELTMTVDRGGSQVGAQGDADPARDQGQFRQYPPERRCSASTIRWHRPIGQQKVGVLPALWMGVEETWFVVDRTMAYLGGIIVGREKR